MTTLQIIYSISTSIAILASLPQIRQLLVTKRSEELNITTWSLWLCTQFVTLSYMVSIRDHLLIAVSTIWLVFYVIMISLILYYRRNPGGVITKAFRASRPLPDEVVMAEEQR